MSEFAIAPNSDFLPISSKNKMFYLTYLQLPQLKLFTLKYFVLV